MILVASIVLSSAIVDKILLKVNDPGKNWQIGFFLELSQWSYVIFIWILDMIISFEILGTFTKFGKEQLSITLGGIFHNIWIGTSSGTPD